ncbi:unnamed protein product [Prunus brigantina]
MHFQNQKGTAQTEYESFSLDNVIGLDLKSNNNPKYNVQENVTVQSKFLPAFQTQ